MTLHDDLVERLEKLEYKVEFLNRVLRMQAGILRDLLTIDGTQLRVTQSDGDDIGHD